MKNDDAYHLTIEEILYFFPIKGVQIEIDELLGDLGLNVAPELNPELVHRKLLRETGLQLMSLGRGTQPNPNKTAPLNYLSFAYSAQFHT